MDGVCFYEEHEVGRGLFLWGGITRSTRWDEVCFYVGPHQRWDEEHMVGRGLFLCGAHGGTGFVSMWSKVLTRSTRWDEVCFYVGPHQRWGRY